MDTYDLLVGNRVPLELPETPHRRWHFVVMGSGIQARKDGSAVGALRWELEAVHEGRMLICAALRDADGHVCDTRSFLYRVERAAPREMVTA